MCAPLFSQHESYCRSAPPRWSKWMRTRSAFFLCTGHRMPSEPARNVLAGGAQRRSEARVRGLIHGDAARANANGDVHGQHGLSRQARSGRGSKGVGIAGMPDGGFGRRDARQERMQQPPQEHASREEDTIDEAGLETFPASDAPGWNPTHAGAPAHRELMLESQGHEVLRAQLRAGAWSG